MIHNIGSALAMRGGFSSVNPLIGRMSAGPEDIFALPQQPRLPYPTPALRPAPSTVPGPTHGGGASALLPFLQSPELQQLIQSFMQAPTRQRRLALPQIAPPPPFGQFRGPAPGLFGG